MPRSERQVPLESVHWREVGWPHQAEVTPRDDLDDWLELSRDAEARVRRRALQRLCPCHVKANVERVWQRVLELVDDPDVAVRRSAVHILCDGSPDDIRAAVVAALESLYHDPDARLRRQVRKLLAHHRRTGRINIL